MTESTYLAAMQKLAAGALPIGELIDAAAQLSRGRHLRLSHQLYKNWIDAHPEHPLRHVLLFNRAALESELGDLDTARASLTSAVELNADFVPAYINLGRLFERAGDPDRAVDLWRQAVNRPLGVSGNSVSYATTALKQMARVLSERQMCAQAEDAIGLSLAIDPNQQELIEQFFAMRLAQCKWPVVVPRDRLDRKALLRCIHPLSLSVYADDPLLQLASADRYVRTSVAGQPHNSDADRRHATIDLSARRLRVGYVSSDLRDHAVGYLMAELFESHRRSDVEVFAYYCGPESNSALTARIKSAVEHWSDIRSLGDDEAARQIAADGIDILVDVNGHTRDARTAVFARRPAPIQVNWLGYPGSMGTPYHHYLIADDWIVPAGSEMYYSEAVLRLPCYQPNDRKRQVAAERPTRSGAGLPETAFVFCCFNGTHKISRFTYERWLEIMRRTPNSVLWLLDTNPEAKTRLGDVAELHGIARSRLVFAPKLANQYHLARYGLADLFLDTAPYGAHTTASDALWMGVPVVTLSGRSFASRVCGSLVRSAGLEELVVEDPKEYVERAVAVANSPDALARYKQRLAASRGTSRLFDTDLLVSRLEALYRDMCRDYQNGRLPQPTLANLDSYLEAGVEFDHDGQDLLAIPDYHGQYKARLAPLHRARPLPADTRLWTATDIAQADRIGTRPTLVETPHPTAPIEVAEPPQRKTGTR
jgi:predicted O-linked N-acetylglucosamine transferase (SPINDLY family)